MSGQALFLYKIQPVRQEMLQEGRTPDEERIISEHFAYLEDLTLKGVVLLTGRTLTSDYAAFGIVILTAESEEAAREVMRNDPAVKGKVMRPELYPFRVSLLGSIRTSDE